MSEIKSGDRVEILDRYGKHEGYAEIISFNPPLNLFVVRFDDETDMIPRTFNRVKPIIKTN